MSSTCAWHGAKGSNPFSSVQPDIAVNVWTRWPASASAVVYVNSNGNVNTNSPANNNYARPDLWRTRDCEATCMVHHTKEAAYYLCYERQR